MNCIKNLLLFLSLLGLLATGCGKDTTLHPLTGNVKLGGKPYERLLVYFRPIDRVVDEYNMGVGETDKDGVLTLRSTAGNGLVKGNYRVTFSYGITKMNGREIEVSMDEKVESPSVTSEELVPEKYTDWEQSPVEFTVSKAGPNHFEFDIPAQ